MNWNYVQCCDNDKNIVKMEMIPTSRTILLLLLLLTIADTIQMELWLLLPNLYYWEVMVVVEIMETTVV